MGKWIIGLTLPLIGIALCAAWKLLPRVPLLPEIATKVIPEGRYYGKPFAFAWLSNEEYCCFGVDGRTLSLYRLGSGASTPLAEPFNAPTQGESIQPSPDGKWLLWSTVTEPPYGSMAVSRVRNYLTRLSDEHTRELNDSDTLTRLGFEGLWEPDSRHIIDVYTTRWQDKKLKAVVRDAFANRVSQKIPFAPDIPGIEGEILVVGSDHLLGVSAMYSPPRLDDTEPVEITEYRLDKTLHIVRKWSVIPSDHPAVKEVRISPTGDRLAWLVNVEYIDPMLARLHRLLPFIKAPSGMRQELRISHMDGTMMHTAGQIPLQVGNENALPLSDLHWLPDGKHLSFAYHQALWTVPAK